MISGSKLSINAIDRSKRGPANHKAFLTKEGKKLVKDRQKDFQFIFLIKEPDDYRQIKI